MFRHDTIFHDALQNIIRSATDDYSGIVTTTDFRGCRSYRLLQLGKQFLHDARSFDACQPRIQTLELHAEPRMIDPQQVQ